MSGKVKSTKPSSGVKRKASGAGTRKKALAGARVRPAGTAQLELEIPIAAPRERVFSALLNETAEWWPSDFFVGGAGGNGAAPSMRIEPRVGGRMYEDWGEGRGVLWATVLTLDPPGRLEMVGMVTPAFGGPLTTIMQFLIEPRGDDACTVRLIDSMIGAVAPGTAASMESGWKLLLGQALREHCESRRAGGRKRP